MRKFITYPLLARQGFSGKPNSNKGFTPPNKGKKNKSNFFPDQEKSFPSVEALRNSTILAKILPLEERVVIFFRTLSVLKKIRFREEQLLFSLSIANLIANHQESAQLQELLTYYNLLAFHRPLFKENLEQALPFYPQLVKEGGWEFLAKEDLRDPAFLDNFLERMLLTIVRPEEAKAVNKEDFTYFKSRINILKRYFSPLLYQELSLGKMLLREAPTGTGKSLAYLVPILLGGKRSFVSTFLKNMQDQLEGDFPKVLAYFEDVQSFILHLSDEPHNLAQFLEQNHQVSAIYQARAHKVNTNLNQNIKFYYDCKENYARQLIPLISPAKRKLRAKNDPNFREDYANLKDEDLENLLQILCQKSQDKIEQLTDRSPLSKQWARVFYLCQVLSGTSADPDLADITLSGQNILALEQDLSHLRTSISTLEANAFDLKKTKAQAKGNPQLLELCQALEANEELYKKYGKKASGKEETAKQTAKNAFFIIDDFENPQDDSLPPFPDEVKADSSSAFSGQQFPLQEALKKLLRSKDPAYQLFGRQGLREALFIALTCHEEGLDFSNLLTTIHSYNQQQKQHLLYYLQQGNHTYAHRDSEAFLTETDFSPLGMERGATPRDLNLDADPLASFAPISTPNSNFASTNTNRANSVNKELPYQHHPFDLFSAKVVNYLDLEEENANLFLHLCKINQERKARAQGKHKALALSIDSDALLAIFSKALPFLELDCWQRKFFLETLYSHLELDKRYLSAPSKALSKEVLLWAFEWRDLDFTVLKGKRNYLCMRAFKQLVTHNQSELEVLLEEEKQEDNLLEELFSKKTDHLSLGQEEFEKRAQLRALDRKVKDNLPDANDEVDSFLKYFVVTLPPASEAGANSQQKIEVRSNSAFENSYFKNKEVVFHNREIEILKHWVNQHSKEGKLELLNLDKLNDDISLALDQQKFLLLNESICTGELCPQASNCPYLKARERAKSAKVVAINHSALIAYADSALLREGLANIVVDEAHSLPEVIKNNTAISFNHREVAKLCDEVNKALLYSANKNTKEARKLNIESHHLASLYHSPESYQVFDLLSERELSDYLLSPQVGKQLFPDIDYPAVDRYFAGEYEFLFKKGYLYKNGKGEIKNSSLATSKGINIFEEDYEEENSTPQSTKQALEQLSSTALDNSQAEKASSQAQPSSKSNSALKFFSEPLNTNSLAPSQASTAPSSKRSTPNKLSFYRDDSFVPYQELKENLALEFHSQYSQGVSPEHKLFSCYHPSKQNSAHQLAFLNSDQGWDQGIRSSLCPSPLTQKVPDLAQTFEQELQVRFSLWGDKHRPGPPRYKSNHFNLSLSRARAELFAKAYSDYGSYVLADTFSNWWQQLELSPNSRNIIYNLQQGISRAQDHFSPLAQTFLGFSSGRSLTQFFDYRYRHEVQPRLFSLYKNQEVLLPLMHDFFAQQYEQEREALEQSLIKEYEEKSKNYPYFFTEERRIEETEKKAQLLPQLFLKEELRFRSYALTLPSFTKAQEEATQQGQGNFIQAYYFNNLEPLNFSAYEQLMTFPYSGQKNNLEDKLEFVTLPGKVAENRRFIANHLYLEIVSDDNSHFFTFSKSLKQRNSFDFNHPDEGGYFLKERTLNLKQLQNLPYHLRAQGNFKLPSSILVKQNLVQLPEVKAFSESELAKKLTFSGYQAYLSSHYLQAKPTTELTAGANTTLQRAESSSAENSVAKAKNLKISSPPLALLKAQALQELAKELTIYDQAESPNTEEQSQQSATSSSLGATTFVNPEDLGLKHPNFYRKEQGKEEAGKVSFPNAAEIIEDSYLVSASSEGLASPRCPQILQDYQELSAKGAHFNRALFQALTFNLGKASYQHSLERYQDLKAEEMLAFENYIKPLYQVALSNSSESELQQQLLQRELSELKPLVAPNLSQTIKEEEIKAFKELIREEEIRQIKYLRYQLFKFKIYFQQLSDLVIYSSTMERGKDLFILHHSPPGREKDSAQQRTLYTTKELAIKNLVREVDKVFLDQQLLAQGKLRAKIISPAYQALPAPSLLQQIYKTVGAFQEFYQLLQPALADKVYALQQRVEIAREELKGAENNNKEESEGDDYLVKEFRKELNSLRSALLYFENMSSELANLAQLLNFMRDNPFSWQEIMGSRYSYVKTDVRYQYKSADFHLKELDARKGFAELKQNYQGIKWIFTSATIGIGGDMSNYEENLGLNREKLDSGLVPSPFRNQENAAFYVPSAQRRGKGDWLFEEAVEMILANEGHCLWLCTSHLSTQSKSAKLKRTLDRHLYTQAQELANAKGLSKKEKSAFIRNYREEHAYNIVFQNENQSRSFLISQLKESKRTILLATYSFWEGVDVPGEALSLVIIDKYPNPMLDAYYQVRSNTTSLDYFLRNVYLPDGYVKLKQGIGRLVRSEMDYGVVMILDPRLRDKGIESYPSYQSNYQAQQKIKLNYNNMYVEVFHNLSLDFPNYRWLTTLEESKAFIEQQRKIFAERREKGEIISSLKHKS